MSVKYFCDICGKELILPGSTNGNYCSNTDGYKTYDNTTGRYLDLCNECSNKYFLEEERMNYGNIKNNYWR